MSFGDYCIVYYVYFDATEEELLVWHLAMKRLYIGGLGHTVTEKDLKDRFGKFGDVTDVEIITRKDDQGRYYVCKINWFDLIWLIY